RARARRSSSPASTAPSADRRRLGEPVAHVTKLLRSPRTGRLRTLLARPDFADVKGVPAANRRWGLRIYRVPSAIPHGHDYDKARRGPSAPYCRWRPRPATLARAGGGTQSRSRRVAARRRARARGMIGRTHV